MSFKILFAVFLTVSLAQAARVYSHERNGQGSDGLRFMTDVVQEVQKDPQVAALIKAGKTETKEFDSLINKKTLEVIKNNPKYKDAFSKSFFADHPFGKSLTPEELTKVTEFLLSDPKLLSKGEEDFNKAAAAALPEIDAKWRAFSKKHKK